MGSRSIISLLWAPKWRLQGLLETLFRQFLREELDLVKPNALILLGSTPAKALIQKSFTLKSERGILFDSELGLPALATYHPAYLLRLRGASSEDYDQTREGVVEDLSAAWEHAQGCRDG
jgi:DNA polymerase